MYYIDQAIEKLEKGSYSNTADKEPSVLEKLLKIDKHAAMVMALDMMMAGVDTVSRNGDLNSTKQLSIFLFAHSDVSDNGEYFISFGKKFGETGKIARRTKNNITRPKWKIVTEKFSRCSLSTGMH